MKEWKQVKVCPVCGGRLVVSDFYSLSRDYRITKKGVLSKRCSTSDPGPLDCTTASCLDCNASWDADHVTVDADSTVQDVGDMTIQGLRDERCASSMSAHRVEIAELVTMRR